MTATAILDGRDELLIDEDGMLSFIMEDGSTVIKIMAKSIDRNKEFVTCNLGNQVVKLVIPQKLDAIVQPVQPALINKPDQFVWDEAATKLFFESYFVNKNKSGKFVIQKKLFELIVSDMKSHGYNVTGLQVSNKYKSLERAYKTHVSTNKTGRGRRVLNHETEITQMFGRKHNITPKVLSGRHGLVSPPNAVIANVDNVDPSPSTSEGHRVQEVSGTDVGQPKDAPIKKRDGKMALALNALKEEVARQAEEQRLRDMLMLAEIKKSNDLKEKANTLRAEKNQLLKEQVRLLKQLLNKDS